jgi:hypothetical protein
MLDVAPALIRLDHLPIGIEVAVIGLGSLQQVNGLVGHPLQFGIGIGGQFVAQGLQPLVDIRIHKHGRAIFALARPRGQAQIVEVAGLSQVGHSQRAD